MVSIAAALLFATVVIRDVPFAVTPPAIVVEFDERQLHGAPIELAWSPDSSMWYLETLEGDGSSATRHHYVVAVGDRAPRPLETAPEWAAPYWSFKSSRAVPAHPTVLIAVEETRRTGNMPSQSLREKARGMSDGATALRGAVDANNDYANAARVLTLTVDGRTISELVDEPLVPGVTFGWSPKELDAIVFRNENHHGLSIWGIGGGTMTVPDTKNVLLPAWSPDGLKIAFLERVGKQKYALRQLNVSLP